ncbi:hypothetical protein [Rhodanobacter ginsenosidimutans]|uniref:DUF3185 domain-containing protein n=1 Tax=Rhodanobacter ginsenosidimutans TaxID=490571 RepID=A0ABW0JRV5_9GAMM
MRMGLIIAGVILLIAGIWVSVGNASYKDTDTVAQLGPAKIEATHDRAVPQWVGIAGIVVGGLLLVGGIANKKR